MTGSLPVAHFDALYARNPDPWALATSPYEVEKYAATVAALGGRHFASAIEIGCAIGTLTERLAPHCTALLGVDFAAAPLVDARARCAAWPGVAFARLTVPETWPAGTFDLIMLSEVLYFLCAADIARLGARVAGCLRPGGMVVLVNWLGPNDGTMPGDAAAAGMLAALPAAWRRAEVVREASYVIHRVDR